MPPSPLFQVATSQMNIPPVVCQSQPSTVATRSVSNAVETAEPSTKKTIARKVRKSSKPESEKSSAEDDIRPVAITEPLKKRKTVRSKAVSVERLVTGCLAKGKTESITPMPIGPTIATGMTKSKSVHRRTEILPIGSPTLNDLSILEPKFSPKFSVTKNKAEGSSIFHKVVEHLRTDQDLLNEIPAYNSSSHMVANASLQHSPSARPPQISTQETPKTETRAYKQPEAEPLDGRQESHSRHVVNGVVKNYRDAQAMSIYPSPSSHPTPQSYVQPHYFSTPQSPVYVSSQQGPQYEPDRIARVGAYSMPRENSSAPRWIPLSRCIGSTKSSLENSRSAQSLPAREAASSHATGGLLRQFPVSASSVHPILTQHTRPVV